MINSNLFLILAQTLLDNDVIAKGQKLDYSKILFFFYQTIVLFEFLFKNQMQ
jgi:hypothetical protein